jgi:hypothetical protein
MNNKINKNQPSQKALVLLPWYASGQLSPEDYSYMEDALLEFPELKAELVIERETIQLLKTDPSILELSALKEIEARFDNILPSLKPQESLQHKQINKKQAVHVPTESKLKQFFSNLLPESGFNGFQYASVAAVAVLSFSAYHFIASKSQETLFYPATDTSAQPTVLNKTNATIILLGINGKLNNDPQLLNVIQKAGAEVSPVPEKDGMYRIFFKNKLNTIEIKDLIKALKSNKELVWFAGEAL